MAGVALAQSQPSNVTVLDEEGNDVTPVSLLATKGGHFKHPMMQGMDMMSAVKESVSDVLNELESMNMASWNSSNFGGRHSASANSRASDISESDDKDDSAESHIGTEDSSAQGSTSATTIANQRALSQMLAAGSGSITAIRSNYASTQIAQSMSMDGSESERYSTTGPGGMVGEGGESQTDSSEKDAALLATLDQDSLKHSLLIMERAVVGNNYENKLIMYRNIQKPQDLPPSARPKTKDSGEEGEDENDEEIIEDDEDEEESYGAHIPTLNALWSYRCEVTRGRSVMYLAWNKENEDILAVAYGENKHAASPHLGLLLVWSLKNPEWPERIYRSAQPVTSVDFSKFTPNLLAAGFADGRIAIYDVRQKTDAAALDNSHIAGKHRDPVWELKWIEREHGMGDDQAKAESLVSISTDGRVCQWQIRKGFEHADLMVLKRVTKQAPESGTGAHSSREGSGSHGKALISRQAGGLCFDFNSKDRN
ncbi:WD repeat-containing protein 78, partial [Rhizoclosmatium hyalinum]